MSEKVSIGDVMCCEGREQNRTLKELNEKLMLDNQHKQAQINILIRDRQHMQSVRSLWLALHPSSCPDCSWHAFFCSMFWLHVLLRTGALRRCESDQNRQHHAATAAWSAQFTSAATAATTEDANDGIAVPQRSLLLEPTYIQPICKRNQHGKLISSFSVFS